MAELVAAADPESRSLWNDLRLGYTESAGHPLLRAEIAKLYPGSTSDDVLMFAGAEEAIFAFMNVALASGDHAVVTWPAYQSLLEVARGVGAEVTPLRLRADRGWRLDIDELAALLRPSTRVVVVNAPHNPTGMLPSHAEFDTLVRLCESRGIALFCDEVYRYGEFVDADRLPGAASASSLGVSLGALSKPLGLAGLRIGWLALRDAALRRRVAAFKDYLTICNSAPSEILGLMALRGMDRLLARNRAIVKTNLAALDSFFSRHGGEFAWVRPRGGLVAFPTLLSKEPVDDFAARLVEKSGVLVLPGSVFDHDGNHFRIGFGRENLPAVLERFEAFVANDRPRPAR
jgi:aspartate/methionine/tyrosine aminotransferase